MASSSVRVLAFDEVVRATAELIFALQKEFPKARLIPCEAIEGEAIHLEVRMLGTEASLRAAQKRAIELKQEVENRYSLFTLVRVVSSKIS